MLNEKIIDELKRHDIVRIHELIGKARLEEYKVCVWGCGVIGRNWFRHLLTHMGVSIDFYCDSDTSLYETEICSGIYAKSFEYLKANTSIQFAF